MAESSELHLDQEVRLAVVMYGGVSLAIYMNGISQELFRLVRSTATDKSEQKLRVEKPGGTELVYRKLARILGRNKTNLDAGADAAVRTRFVIDVLSGTSAGGINGVFLAKALVRGQNIDQLESLWKTEGALEKLINDSGSTSDSSLRTQEPPPSLLNGERMYLKLLAAFDDMEKAQAASRESTDPYVDEMDLFVTTTDIRGLALRLGLSDAEVKERRHKKVFHFKYPREIGESPGVDTETADFDRDMNPFLAFTSRCTSSFPFAFEPMRLDAVDSLRRHVAGYEDDAKFGAKTAPWKRFFDEYLGASDGGGSHPDASDTVPYYERAFGDGGYLDNKPFGYAIDALATRHSPYPVVRKFVYIEPSPEKLSPNVATESPDAIENVIAALTLSSYETIREDLQAMLRRNRLIERVRRLTERVELDIRAANVTTFSRPLGSAVWATSKLSTLMQQFGASYGGYHRLRVATVTDELALTLTCAAGFNDRSDEFWAIRILLREWRVRTFAEEGSSEQDNDGRTRRTETDFLFKFDIGVIERRLVFLRAKIDDLLGRDVSDVNTLLNQITIPPPGSPDEAKNTAEVPIGAVADIDVFRDELRTSLSPLVVKAFDALETAIGVMRDYPKGPVADILAANTAVTVAELHAILQSPSDDSRAITAGALLTKPDLTRLEQLDALEIKLRAPVEACAAAGKLVIPPPDGANADRDKARRVIQYFFDTFERYDIITFPIFTATEVGETVPVDIVRFSPDDACALVPPGKGRRKLAGQTLFNFGAFLEESWRTNDVLWGRLDGAERIISSLLPGGDDDVKRVRDGLVQEAHEAIFAEFIESQKPIVAETLTAGLMRDGTADGAADSLERSLGTDKATRDRLKSVLTAGMDPRELRLFYRDRFSADLSFDKERALKDLSRAVIVIGGILKGISRRSRLAASPATWLTRVGRVLWGYVEVSVPGGVLQLLWKHWLNLAAVCGALLLLVSLAVNFPNGQTAGWIILGVVLGLHAATVALGAYLTGRSRWLRVARLLLIGTAVGLIALGGLTAVQWIRGLLGS